MLLAASASEDWQRVALPDVITDAARSGVGKFLPEVMAASSALFTIRAAVQGLCFPRTWAPKCFISFGDY